MRKIPTLYQRTEDRRHVTDVVTPGCEWVLAGEGIPTRKLDGVCLRFDGALWWARREVKPEGREPDGFFPIEYDTVTGKTVGWEPIGNSPFQKFWLEAVSAHAVWEVGTYELIGPKINRNPEAIEKHALVRHGLNLEVPRHGTNPTPETLIGICRDYGWEGIVWHHPDGRMAKLKVRDYPRITT